jgi:hypothetical protein
MPAITLPALGLWMGIASLIFGIIVMIFPKILNYLLGTRILFAYRRWRSDCHLGDCSLELP